MRRIKDNFLEVIEGVIPLGGTSVLEVGCGDGSRSVQIAGVCRVLIALDPNLRLIRQAESVNFHRAIHYVNGSAEELPLQSEQFDVVIFTLSFHHIPGQEGMSRAINEAIRVLRSDGFLIFFEPTFNGSFFEGEIYFDACDGDERREKALAYYLILSHRGLVEVAELYDETLFHFYSENDYRESLNPKRNLGEIRAFLRRHNYTLRAERRINICRIAGR